MPPAPLSSWAKRISKHLYRLLCTFSFMSCQHKKCMHNQLGVNKQTRRPVGVNQRAQRFVCTQAFPLPNPPPPPYDPHLSFDYSPLPFPALTLAPAHCRLYALDSSANKQQVDLEIYLENSKKQGVQCQRNEFAIRCRKGRTHFVLVYKEHKKPMNNLLKYNELN